MTTTDRGRSAGDILVSGQRPHEQVLDEVYRRYAHSDPFLPVVHFVDHATMGSEALVGLGLGHEVPAWLSRLRVRPYTAPRTGVALPAAWKQAIGQRDCHGDWIAFFDAELASSPFPDVLTRWIPRFAHAVEAYLFHGLIRTAHAVRSLDHEDTPARRGELARGLALWAIGIHRPPVDAVPERAAKGDWALEVLRYARAGAATLVDSPSVPNVHLVTGPMAYMLMGHHLDAGAHDVALTAFARTHAKALREFERLRAKALFEPNQTLNDSFLDSLSRGRDAHPIKLTEAALRAHEATNDEIFLRAVGTVRRLHGLRSLLGIARANL